jgi:hypothetical protein
MVAMTAKLNMKMADHHLWLAHRMSPDVYKRRSAGIRNPKNVPISSTSQILMIIIATIVGRTPPDEILS